MEIVKVFLFCEYMYIFCFLYFLDFIQSVSCFWGSASLWGQHPTISDCILCLFFCDWVISLRMIFSRCSHFLKNLVKSLFLVAEQYSIVYMYHNFCIHSSSEGHLGSFQLLAIINRAAMNIVVHISLLCIKVSLGYMPRSGIAGSSGSTISNFLRYRQTDFQSGCISLQPHQQWRSVPLSPQHVPWVVDNA